MTHRRDQLGDLPQDIGSDHQQLFSPQTGEAGQERGGSGVPGWARWLAGVLVPNLFPALKFSVRPFIAGVESVELVGGKKTRRYLLIQNNSTADLYVNFGQDAVPISSIKIAAGGYYEPYRVPVNAIYVQASAANASCVLVEG